MKRVLIGSIAIILGIVVGGVAGGYMTFHRYAREYALVHAFAWVEITDAVSENEFNENSSDARQGLLVALSLYTQGIKSSAVDPKMKSALRMNSGLLEARLSIIENESGDVEGAKSYLTKAQDDLKAVGWVDYSEANILQAVRRQSVSLCDPAQQNAAKANTSTTPKPCG